ncbi:MAG TPA: GAF domain-containing protein, partial [Chryseolinea sp.]|nr:GAF domain-containing protein [Chryseolinea sp.]
MNFDFSKVKLSLKLALLIALPLLALVSISFYTLSKNAQSIINHPMLFTLMVALFIAYIFLAVNFTLKLIRGVRFVESNVKNLASGRFNANVDVTGLHETVSINDAVKKLEDHLHRQTKFAEQIKSRNLDTSYNLCHDHDHLGQALLDIKENLITVRQEDEQRKWASESLATFVEVLQSAKNLKELSNEIIINLVRILQASQGALFMLVKNSEGEQLLEMQACYAFNRTKHLTQQIAIGDGLIGQVFLEKETIYLKDVPDRFVRITSGLGEANPRHVLIVPLKLNETAEGIVELASFKEFSKHQIEFVEKIGESIAHTISSFRIAENTKKLLDESQAHAEQMRAQEEELRQNQEELQATQETISRKYDSLFKKLGDLNHQSKFDQLKSITSTKKRNVEYYFDIIRNQILTFSEDRMMIEAVKAFRLAFQKISEDVSNDTIRLMKKNLLFYYEKEFIPKLNDNFDLGSLVNQYMPTELKVLCLQYLYISNNPHPVGKKLLMDDPGDGSDYSRAHALYHPILRNFLEKFGYYDIFLID